MFVVAACFDGLQCIFSTLGFFLVVIPGLGLILAGLTILANIAITVFAALLFGMWLMMSGHWNSKAFRLALLSIFLEIFSAGILPMWTVFLWRLRKGEKVEEVFKRKAVLRT